MNRKRTLPIQQGTYFLLVHPEQGTQDATNRIDHDNFIF